MCLESCRVDGLKWGISETFALSEYEYQRLEAYDETADRFLATWTALNNMGEEPMLQLQLWITGEQI